MQLEHSQNQVLSQRMIQSVQILQMSAQELTEYVKEMSLENPLVEMEENEWGDKEKERLRKLEWLSGLDEQNRIYYRQEREDSDLNDIMNIGQAEEETLADSLMGQLIGKDYSGEAYRVFEYIAECLDSRGFFTGTVAEIASHFGIYEEEAEELLQVMKSLDPAGVCAQNLSECLLEQLSRLPEECEVEKKIVTSYLELLGKNQLHVIAKQMKLPPERVQQAKERIQKLNPKPGSGFADREVLRYLTPDVTVVKLQDYFEVMVNDCTYPEVRVNKEYVSMLKSGECPKDVQHYLSEKVKQIEQVQSSISKRNSTLLDLTKCLVAEQKEFFLYGKGHLRPYKMQDAAEALQVHESTVSRAVKEKYLQCCWGIFPLGYFFSKGFYKDESKENIATDQIKEKLQELIEGEDKKKPLSDQKLTNLLTEAGVEISRRTVAKYREALGIPDCRGRKEF